jgi:2-hydroxy-3-oxopropionate reductase
VPKFAANLTMLFNELPFPDRFAAAKAAGFSGVQELVAAGGIVCKSGREVAEEADVVIVMVPDTPQVEAVVFGAKGVAEGISKGKFVVDMSSISPLATKEFAKKINARGADYLDAPVSGGEVCAKAASLTIMVGR